MSSTLPIDRGSRKVSALRKTKNSASAKTNVVNPLEVNVDGPPPTASSTTSHHSTETLDKKDRNIATTCRCCSAFYAYSCCGKQKKIKEKPVYRPHLMPDFRRWNRLPDRDDHAASGAGSVCTLLCRVGFAALVVVMMLVFVSTVEMGFNFTTFWALFWVLLPSAAAVVVTLVVVLPSAAGSVCTRTMAFAVLVVVIVIYTLLVTLIVFSLPISGNLVAVALVVVALVVVAYLAGTPKQPPPNNCRSCRKFLEEIDRPREISSIPTFNPKRVQDNLCCRYCCFCCTRLCCWNSRCPCAKCDKYVPCFQKFPSSNDSHLGRDRCPTLTYIVIAW